MKKRVLLIAAVMLLTTALASAAGAAPPSCDDRPDHPQCTTTTTSTPSTTTTTTTEVPPAFWTCQARGDNGAMWDLGAWTGTAYVAGMSSCTDILAEHLGVSDWTVEWEGVTQNGTVKGIRLVFEEEVHDNVFADEIFSTETGEWCPTLTGGIENLVFVAMPHNADKWLYFEVTVTPGHDPLVCST